MPSAIQPQNPQGLNQVVVDLTTGDDPPSQSGNHGNVEEYTSNVKQERAVGATPPPQVVSSGKSAQATRPPSPLSILLPATEESQIDPPTERARSSSLIDVSEDEDPKEHHLWDIEQWDPRIHGEADDDNTPMDDAARASLSGCGVVVTYGTLAGRIYCPVGSSVLDSMMSTMLTRRCRLRSKTTGISRMLTLFLTMTTTKTRKISPRWVCKGWRYVTFCACRGRMERLAW